MPALGNSGRISPRAIKEAAKKAAPPARSLGRNIGPGRTSYGPVPRSTPAPRPAPSPAFGRNLQKTMGPLGKSKLLNPREEAQGERQILHERAERQAKEGRSFLQTILGESGDVKKAERSILANKPPVNLGVASPTGFGGFTIGSAAAGQTLKGLGEPKGGGFVSKFYNSLAKTLASMPAGFMETVRNPQETFKGMEHLYTHIPESFHENPAGTVLSLFPLVGGIDRGAGAAIRGVSKGKLLALDRPDLAYPAGVTQARSYEPGAVSGTLQRIPDKVMKAVGKGERPIQRGTKPPSAEKLPPAMGAPRATANHTGAVPITSLSLHPADTVLKGQIEGGRVQFHHTRSERGFSTNDMHHYDITPVGGKTFAGKDYAGRPKTYHYDPEVSRPYTATSHSGKPVTDFKTQPGWTPDSQFAQHVGEKPGVVYRGISREEWEHIQRTGRVQSHMEYNVGGEKGTLWSRDPAQAFSYASGFAPNHLKPGFEKPGYVIAVKEPGDAVANHGNETERVVKGHIPSDQVLHAYEIRPTGGTGGDIRVIREGHDPGYRSGGGGIHGGSYAFREVQPPAAHPLAPYQLGHAPSDIPLHEAGKHPSEPLVGKAVQPADHEAIAQIKAAEGRPNHLVTIYRATSGDRINPHDWVTTSKAYAERFAKNHEGTKILTSKVPARDVYLGRKTGLGEAGYHPEPPPVMTSSENPHGIHEVSGAEFTKAVAEARSGSPRIAANVTEHPASRYTQAFLTKDGKAGVAVRKTGKRLSDGRPEVELVNLFNHGSKKGAGRALEDHAIRAGANKLDALEGYLTHRYASQGWKVVRSEPWDTKYGEPPKVGQQVYHMQLPEVNAATRLQTRRDILGSRAGGIVRPGQIDLIRSAEKLARNLETMKRHDFLRKYLPEDEAHATALMTFLQGEARRPETFWHDVAERKAELIERADHERLTGRDLAYNKDQIKRLQHLEDNKSSVSHEDLEHHAKGAHEIAVQQRLDWEALNLEGVGEPGQLNARNLPALLAHGHLLGRGKLEFLSKPGLHPLDDMAKKAEQRAKVAKDEIRNINAELHGKVVPKHIKEGRHFAKQEAEARRDQALLEMHDYRNQLTTMVHKGELLPNKTQFPGLYDSKGNRVTAEDTQAFLNEHFGGREMGFLTQRQPKVMAQTQNSYGPRSLFPMRTGGNFRNGTYDNSPAALRNHFDRAAYNLATMRGRRSIGENLVLVNHDGTPFKDQRTAEIAADNANSTPGSEPIQHHLGKLVPFNMGALKVADKIDGSPYGSMLEMEGIIEHKAVNEEQGAWGLLPEKVAERLNKWDSVEKQIAHSPMRLMTTPWRQTNLYTSVRWPVGTTQENAIRLAAHKVSPLVVFPGMKKTSLSFGTGSHIVKFLDDKIHDPTVGPMQKQLAIFHRSQFGTGNFAGAQLHELEPALHEFEEKTLFRRLGDSAPNTKIWRPYRKLVGDSLNKMETNAKVAAGGKLALNDAAFFDKYRSISREQAARNYVEKITSDPAESIKQAQNLMEIMGNWNHLTPYTRQAQAEFAPFALWWLNSAKFVFKTMPKDHPYATGLLAAMVTATGAANRDLKEYLTGTVPLHLPLIGDINLNPVHYSPFDIGHEPLHTAAGMIAPQLQEPIEEAKGIDPLTGDKFVKGEGSEDIALGHLGASTAQSFLPGMRIASQLLRGGGRNPKTAFLPWEVEPGTSEGIEQAALKTFSPFMYTKNRQKAKEEAAAKAGGKRGFGGNRGFGSGRGFGGGSRGFGK